MTYPGIVLGALEAKREGCSKLFETDVEFWIGIPSLIIGLLESYSGKTVWCESLRISLWIINEVLVTSFKDTLKRDNLFSKISSDLLISHDLYTCANDNLRIKVERST